MSADRSSTGDISEKRPTAFLPPRWFIRAAWIGHRALYDVTGGRLGLRDPSAQRWGLMRLRTIGRRSGEERIAILAYFLDGPDIVTMAMNGWGEAEPAWWLNLLDHPDAEIALNDGRTRVVRARVAVGEERDRLWEAWRSYTPHLDAYATKRATETAVVILEPRRD